MIVMYGITLYLLVGCIIALIAKWFIYVACKHYDDPEWVGRGEKELIDEINLVGAGRFYSWIIIAWPAGFIKDKE